MTTTNNEISPEWVKSTAEARFREMMTVLKDTRLSDQRACVMVRIYEKDPVLQLREPHNNRTLLHLAALYNRGLVSRKLIILGAEVNAKDGNEQTPLHIACQYRSWRVSYQLLRINASDSAQPDDEENETQNDISKSNQVIIKPAEVNALDRDQRTPLHYVATQDRELIVKLLLAGANITLKDKWDKTPLWAFTKSQYARRIDTMLSLYLKLIDYESHSGPLALTEQRNMRSLLDNIDPSIMGDVSIIINLNDDKEKARHVVLVGSISGEIEQPLTETEKVLAEIIDQLTKKRSEKEVLNCITNAKSIDLFSPHERSEII
ncbi:MAG: ankyrin repeat domain-containing protein, partial [Coxiellaceae bacterium]|nr:ankyrin repeat domain-containing protein [Coxiellaceae bacterium]